MEYLILGTSHRYKNGTEYVRNDNIEFQYFILHAELLVTSRCLKRREIWIYSSPYAKMHHINMYGSVKQANLKKNQPTNQLH